MKLIVFLAGFAFFAQAHADNCPCLFGPGIDGPCGIEPDSSEEEQLPLLVRPVPVPKPNIIPVPEIKLPEIPLPPLSPPPPILPTLFPLKPMGGPCFCKKIVVKPAIVPKPPCFDASSVKIEQSQIQQQINAAAHSCQGGVVRNPAHCAPADAVSLAIAYKLAQKAKHSINEDRLSYGFRRLPKEEPKPIRKETPKFLIPEGNLYDLNGEIVELKQSNVASCGGQTLEEEAAEELLDLLEEEIEHQAKVEEYNAKRVTLGELGYQPAKIQPATFVEIAPPVEAAVAAVESVLENLGGGGGGGCLDGYVPGEVVKQNVPKRQTIVKPPQPPPSCVDSVEDEEIEYLYPTASCGSVKSTHQKHSIKQTSSHSTYRKSGSCRRY